MSSRSITTEAIILKRRNSGETDRLVTLITPDHGKIQCVAKGVRKITSSKRAFLEPGNYIKCQLIMTSSMPLLIQATLIDDCHEVQGSLPKMRQLVQLLEIFDTVLVEEEMEPELFENILSLRKEVLKEKVNAKLVRQKLEELLMELGFQDPKDTRYTTIMEYVSVIADKPMKSWEYLKV